MKFPENFRQDRGHRESRERHPQVADLTAREGSEVGRDGRKPPQKRFDAIQEESAGRGDFNPPTRAVQKIRIQCGLQLRDRSTQRWLRNRQGLGGFSEVQLARDLTEIHQVPELEGELISARHRLRRQVVLS